MRLIILLALLLLAGCGGGGGKTLPLNPGATDDPGRARIDNGLAVIEVSIKTYSYEERLGEKYVHVDFFVRPNDYSSVRCSVSFEACDSGGVVLLSESYTATFRGDDSSKGHRFDVDQSAQSVRITSWSIEEA